MNFLGTHHRPLLPSQNLFNFSDAKYKSLGISMINLETPSGIPPIMIKMHVVSADIPDLLGINLLECETITPYTVSNTLINRVTVRVKIVGTYM